MKRFLIIPIMALVVGLAACGGGGGGSDGVGGETASTPTQPPIQTPPFSQTFSGSTDSVIPPLSLPAGLYKVTVTTSRYVILKEVTTGGRSLLNLSAGEASEGAEALFHATSDGAFVFQLSNIGASWTLTIESMDLNNPANITDVGLVNARGPKVLGPYRVDRNDLYLFTLLCNSYFIMIPYSPYTGDRGSSVFNESRGNYGAQTTATFSEGLVLFHTYNMSESWSVTAQKL